MKRVLTAVILFMLTPVLLLSCDTSDHNTDSPEKAAKAWVDAFLKLDGNALTERTCSDKQAEVQTAGFWMSAFSVLGELLVEQELDVDTDDLSFTVLGNRDEHASVRVHGIVRSAVLAYGQETPIDTTFEMVFETKKWKWCGETAASASAQENTTATSTFTPDPGATEPHYELKLIASNMWMEGVFDPGPGWQPYVVELAFESLGQSNLIQPFQLESPYTVGDAERGEPYSSLGAAYVQTDNNVAYNVDFTILPVVGIGPRPISEHHLHGIPTHTVASAMSLAPGIIVESVGSNQYNEHFSLVAYFAVPETMRPTALVVPGYPEISLNTAGSIAAVDPDIAQLDTLPKTFALNDQFRATLQPLRWEYVNKWQVVVDVELINEDRTRNQQVPVFVTTLVDSNGVLWEGSHCDKWPEAVGPGQATRGSLCITPGVVSDPASDEFYLSVTAGTYDARARQFDVQFEGGFVGAPAMPGIQDVVGGEPVATYEPSQPPHGLIWTPEGSAVVITYGDGTLELWDPAADTHQQLVTENPCLTPVMGQLRTGAHHLSLSSDGEFLAVGHDKIGYYRNKGLWVIATREWDFDRCLDYSVDALAWSPGGAYLAIADTGGFSAVHILDKSRWNINATLLDETIWGTISSPRGPYLNHYSVPGLAWNPDGTALAMAINETYMSHLVIMDTIGQQVTHQMSRQDFGDWRAIIWSPDGARLATASSQQLDIWDTLSWDAVTVKDLRCQDLSWSSDGTTLVCGEPSGVYVVDPTNGQFIPVTLSQNGAEYTISASQVAWSPDGRLLAVANSALIVVWSGG